MSYKYALKKVFTKEQITQALKFESDTTAAIYLSDLEGAPQVSRQNVTYWRKQATKSVDLPILRKRSVKDWAAVTAKVTTPTTPRVILVIPDLHIPYHHPKAFDFIQSLIAKYQPDLCVSLGDEVDNHALSMHDSDPNLDSAGTELAQSRVYLGQLAKIVPNLLVCHSNHGSLAYRRSKKFGIPMEMLKSYRDILFPNGGGDGWDWAYSHTIPTDQGAVMFKHQAPGGPATHACHEGVNVVLGHMHGSFNIEYKASSHRLYYGVTSGCLIDSEALAFAYGKEFPNKPILGATLITDGVPRLIPMVL
jgi:hypothetical protein